MNVESVVRDALARAAVRFSFKQQLRDSRAT